MTTEVSDISIPRNNYDLFFKAMAEQFEDQVLDFYNIRLPPIVRAEPTELTVIDVRGHRLDFLFLLEDDTYLHVEFQTRFDREALERFMDYDVALYKKKKRTIHTFVIYGADVQKAQEVLDHGSIIYRTSAVYMNNYDGDQILGQLREKVIREENLTEQDQLHLILLPLMRSSVKRRERAKETMHLAKSVPDRKQQFRLMGSIITVSEKFLEQEDLEQIVEVMKMSEAYRIFHEKAVQEGLHEGIAKGFQEGILKGKEEGLHEGIAKGLHEGIAKGLNEGKQEAQILIAKNLLSLGIDVDKIAEGTGLRIDEVEKLRDIH